MYHGSPWPAHCPPGRKAEILPPLCPPWCQEMQPWSPRPAANRGQKSASSSAECLDDEGRANEVVETSAVRALGAGKEENVPCLIVAVGMIVAGNLVR